MDALADHPNQVDKSPYQYAWNNPVLLTDPDGNCPKCPDEVYVPLANHVYSANVGDVTENGWEVIRVDKSTESGFHAAIYKGSYNGKTEYIYATAGTEELKQDGIEDIEQLFGGAEQYVESVGQARQLSDKYSGISFTGHSLGGGLASANALAVEGKGVTFNAAGLTGRTKANLGLKGQSANITAYVVSGEAVHLSQKKIGLRAEGNIHFIPGTGGGAINNHLMKAVIDGFKLYQSRPEGKTFNYERGK